MPADFKLDPSKRILYSRAWGDLIDKDLLGHREEIKALFNQGVLDSDWAQISDFTAVTSVAGVSSEGIHLLAQRNPWPRETIRVIIVPSDVVFGLTRMYQLMGDLDASSLRITRVVSEAESLVHEERARRRCAEPTPDGSARSVQ